MSRKSAGMTIHIQDGDRMEKPWNTGCSTHADFSAAEVAAAATTGDRPALMTQISSGASAAMATQAPARMTTAALPITPGSRVSAVRSRLGLPSTTRPTIRTNVTPAKPAVSCFIAEPQRSSAKYGPECSKGRASSLIPNSAVPVWVSTGIRPVS